MSNDAPEATNVVPLRPDIPDECGMGMHSWTDEAGKLPPDTECTHCGELYGDPD